MTNKPARALILSVAIVAGVGSFVLTRVSLTADELQGGEKWAENLDPQAAARDQQVRAQVRRLKETYSQRQLHLAALLEAGAPSEEIMRQSESVSSAHENLLRVVADHVISLRGQVSGKSRQYLMQSCSGQLCRGCRGAGCGMGRGRRRGMGRMGQGRGRGRNRAGACQAFTDTLMLTEQQNARVAAVDPNAAVEIAGLQQDLMAVRHDFAQAITDDQIGPEQLHRTLDKVVDLHRALDKRIIEHVLALREVLTVSQQKRLAGLCRGSGGRRRLRRGRGI